jgi:hypothetical protein
LRYAKKRKRELKRRRENESSVMEGEKIRKRTRRNQDKI